MEEKKGGAPPIDMTNPPQTDIVVLLHAPEMLLLAANLTFTSIRASDSAICMSSTLRITRLPRSVHNGPLCHSLHFSYRASLPLFHPSLPHVAPVQSVTPARELPSPAAPDPTHTPNREMPQDRLAYQASPLPHITVIADSKEHSQQN